MRDITFPKGPLWFSIHGMNNIWHRDDVKTFIVMMDIGRCFIMKMNILTHSLSNQKYFSRTDNLIQVSMILPWWLSDLVEGVKNKWILPIFQVIRDWSKGKYRLCPGYHIAFWTLWPTAVTVLATFNLSKAVDKDGRVIEPSCEYFNGTIWWVKQWYT